MSADKVINLNKVRKQRQRAADRTQAERNRVLHGRTGAEKARSRKDAEQKAKLLDGKRIGAGDGPDGDGGSRGP